MTYFFVPLRFITMAWAHWWILDARWLRFAAALTFDVRAQMQLRNICNNPQFGRVLGVYGGRRAMDRDVAAPGQLLWKAR